MTNRNLERDGRLRCKSDFVETPGRTHRCKLTLLHDGTDHECICSIRWPRKKPVPR